MNYIVLYEAISYFGKKKEEKRTNIVNSRNKLSVLIDQKVNKEEIQLKLTNYMVNQQKLKRIR